MMGQASDDGHTVSDGAIRSERVFLVSREVLYSAFADPAVLASWWGPRGSVNQFEVFDLRPGGAWRFRMRASDGAEYPMDHEFIEVAAPAHVTFRHLQEGHGFELRMDFDAIGPGESRLRWRMTFDDKSEGDRVRQFILAANEENFDRLGLALGRST